MFCTSANVLSMQGSFADERIRQAIIACKMPGIAVFPDTFRFAQIM